MFQKFSLTLTRRSYLWFLLFQVFISPASYLFANDPAPGASNKPRKLGIAGDSLSTGAATNPALLYDPDMLSDLLLADTDRLVSQPDQINLVAPNVLAQSDPFMWFSKIFHWFLGSRYFNDENNSWAALIGKNRNFLPENIFLAANNGARMRDANGQLGSILRANDDIWPDEILIFFTGNDLCAPNPADLPSREEGYIRHLERTLRFLQNKGQTPPGGTKVFIVMPLLISQLVSRNEILDKTVLAFGEQTSCRQVIENRFQAPPAAEGRLHAGIDGKEPKMLSSLLKNMLPPNYAQMCPTLFYFPPQNPEHMTALVNTIRAIQKRVVEEYRPLRDKTKPKATQQKMDIYLLESTKDLIFQAEHIANDCFHLSQVGQSFLAETVSKELNAIAKP